MFVAWSQLRRQIREKGPGWTSEMELNIGLWEGDWEMNLSFFEPMENDELNGLLDKIL